MKLEEDDRPLIKVDLGNHKLGGGGLGVELGNGFDSVGRCWNPSDTAV